MLLSFQRPPSLPKGLPSEETDPTQRPEGACGPTREYSASDAAPCGLARRAGGGSGACRPSGPARRPARPARRARRRASWHLAERHAALVDQPPRLRARDPELARRSAPGRWTHARRRCRSVASSISSGASCSTNTRSKCRSAAAASSRRSAATRRARARARAWRPAASAPCAGARLAGSRPRLEQQPVVLADRLVGDRHRLAVHLLAARR